MHERDEPVDEFDVEIMFHAKQQQAFCFRHTFKPDTTTRQEVWIPDGMMKGMGRANLGIMSIVPVESETLKRIIALGGNNIFI